MRASGGLKRDGEGQGWRYGLSHTVRLGNANTLTADADAVVERRAWVEVIAFGELQINENLASGASLYLLRRHLHDFLVAKIGVTEASHSHGGRQAAHGQCSDVAGRQIGDADSVVVGVGNV